MPAQNPEESNIDPVTSEDTSEQIYEDLTVDKDGWTRTEDRQEIFVPIHGFTWFFPEEVEIINHPAFQRLAGMHQLGHDEPRLQRSYTWPEWGACAWHCGVAQRMLDATEHNCKRQNIPGPKDQWVLGCPPTPIEKRFVRLATLLHDIGHVPYGHTVEDELRLLDKHDGERRVDKISHQRNMVQQKDKNAG